MDAQTIWNLIIALVNLAIGGAIKLLYDALRELHTADTKLVERVQQMELLVTGEYVKRDDLDAKMDRLFTKLETIEAKLDTKVNRHECLSIHARASDA